MPAEHGGPEQLCQYFIVLNGSPGTPHPHEYAKAHARRPAHTRVQPADHERVIDEVSDLAGAMIEANPNGFELVHATSGGEGLDLRNERAVHPGVVLPCVGDVQEVLWFHRYRVPPSLAAHPVAIPSRAASGLIRSPSTLVRFLLEASYFNDNIDNEKIHEAPPPISPG
jgi:hypothetical protein